LEARLAAPGAAAILKVGRHLPQLRALLDRLGRAGSATYVAHASRADEVVAPLGDPRILHAPYFSMVLLPAERPR
jgi:precorrin-2/cobalt-factor-2 C20-methyltransferase